MIRVLDSADSTLVEWGRQQQQHDDDGCDVVISAFLVFLFGMLISLARCL